MLASAVLLLAFCVFYKYFRRLESCIKKTGIQVFYALVFTECIFIITENIISMAAKGYMVQDICD